MCGIAGLLDPFTPPNDALLRRMGGLMAARGPDDEGYLNRNGVGLVHRRLSIIDLQGGRQPIFNEDETLAIVCNGEIYDFQALRSELLGKGHRFRTRSDSEVVLHLYEELGELCLDRLNGMFACAIADFAKGAIFLARDRLGQKPLFYAASAGRFAFASGPAALAAVPWVDATVSPHAIHDFLEYQYIPRPRSIYRGVRKLPPGHFLYWHPPGRANTGGNETPSPAPACPTSNEPRPYWGPDLLPGFGGDMSAAAGAARRLLADAVARRLVAEVPLGAFLSGGVDSSIVCLLAQDALRAAGGGPLKTYSVGFPIAKFDEREYAAAVAGHLKTEHHFLEVNPADFTKLATVVADFEEPFADASMLPTWLLSEFTRRHVTVALSGDGADELFGGYYRYRVMHLCRLLAAVPRGLRQAVQRPLLALLPVKTEERTAAGRLRRLVELLDVDGLQRYLRLISRFPEPLRRRLYTDHMLAATGECADIDFLAEHMPAFGTPTDRIMELDCRTYLPEDILTKVDRASMAHALEVRSPFLDVNVAEFALSLPYAFKQRGACRKRVLRHAFAERLPAGVFSRPKMGFGLPIARWFRDPWRQPTRDILLSGVLDDYFRRERLAWLLDEHGRSRADYSYGLFALTVLALWLERHRTDACPASIFAPP